MKTLEQEYDQLAVRGANEKNIIYSIEAAASGRYDLRVTGHVSASAAHEEIGRAVFAVWSQHRRLQ